MGKDTRQQSREGWNAEETFEAINAGSLQRIADATEKMAQNYVKLENDYKYMREDRDRYRARYEKELKRSAAYRGVINRMKKK